MLIRDQERGRQVAELLYERFLTTGIHGMKHMPEDALPMGVEKGSLEHALFITLTVSIDYQRNANALWDASRKTFEDPETRYLFDPCRVYETSYDKLIRDMGKHRLAKKPRNDLRTWHTNAVTLLKKYNGSPLDLVKRCNYEAPAIIETLVSGHHEQNGKWVLDFPYLRGPKIGPLWVRMLRDNVGLDLKRMDELPIPVDVHIARATMAVGVVRGQSGGPLEDLHEEVRKAWRESVVGLSTGTRPMMAMDLDEALWHLSKYGCSDRDTSSGECPHLATCEASNFCVKGKVIVGSKVEIDT